MKSRQCGGFTLIEVVVALIILGLSLSAVFQVLSSSRRISLKADEMLTAVRLAQNLLANPALIDTALKGREVAGAVPLEAHWRYSLSAVPLEFGTGSRRDVLQVPAMYELKLCLFHETDRREKIFCVKQWQRR